MDMSNRLSFVTGTLRIPADEIQPNEWVAIIDAMLAECKPNLKYMRGFREIKTLLNTQNGHDSRNTPQGTLEFPEGITESTRCLAVIYPRRYYNNPDSNFVELNLLLTDSGEMIKWIAKYNQRTIGGLGFRGHKTGTLEEAEWSRFSRLDDAEFERVVTGDSRSPKEIMENLIGTMVSTVKEKQAVIQTLMEKHSRMLGMYRRIEFPSH